MGVTVGRQPGGLLSGRSTDSLSQQERATSVLDCPSGQTSTLTQVVYSNVTVTDETSGAFLSIPGTFSAGAKVGHGNN